MEGKMFKRVLVLIAVLAVVCLSGSGASFADEIKYMQVDEFKDVLDNKEPVIIADIQEAKKFVQHYFFGSVETNAYPVRSDEEKKKLNKIINAYDESGKIIIIVGPRGTTGAKRAYKYLQEHDVPQDKIYILEGGVRGWPHKKMFINVAGGCA